MTWQPIETAPKDGTRILVWVPSLREVMVANWAQGGRYKQRRWALMHYQGYLGSTEKFPTHWMPLPEPPMASKSEAG